MFRGIPVNRFILENERQKKQSLLERGWSESADCLIRENINNYKHLLVNDICIPLVAILRMNVQQCGLSIGLFTFDVDPFKGQGQGRAHFI